MVGLVVFALGAVVGFLAGNKELREQVRQKSKELLNKE
jgi:hypothetical protein